MADHSLKHVLSGRGLCVASIVVFMLLTAVEGTWGVEIHRSPLMWAAAILMMLSLALTLYDSVKERRSISGTLSHAGMFLLLFGSLSGAPAFVDVQMTVIPGQEVNEAFSREGRIVPLPFGISLKEFCIDRYDDGVSPKQYTSTLLVDGHELSTSVNHPCRYGGYNIYQSGYDSEDSSYSVIKLVHDPWLPVVYLGLFLLVLGAVMGLKRYWDSWMALAATGTVAVVFGILSLASISFGTLVPALRSLWFIPHIALYMLAYASLGLALVTGIIFAVRPDAIKMETLSTKLSGTASSLLLLGMICGAVWAKAAWGDWWTWDAKECWAAVTWFLTIVGTHLPHEWMKGRRATLICLILAFIAMQVAWYGVDFLPAAQNSLHAYK